MARKSRARRAKRGQNVTVTVGRGGYFDKSKKGEVTAIGRALRTLGSLGGGSLAPYLGGDPATGSAMGSSLGAHVSKWLGYGAYTVKRNTVLTPGSSIPMMHSTGQSVIVRHKEYVCDVVGGAGTPSAYTLMPPVYLNPGLKNSFPWLSSIARQYQEYTWRGVVYHFVSSSGASVSSTNTSLGTVMMHTDYRVTAPSPLNKAELLNEYFASDAKPSDSFVHPIECDPRENPYNVQYVRTGPVPDGEDPKSYDLGKVNVATQALPSAGMTVGELWVTYEVELRKPQVANFSGDSSFYKAILGIDTTHLLGTARTQYWDNIGLSLSGNKITFPTGLIGTFSVDLSLESTTNNMIADLVSSTTFTNCTLLTIWGPGNYNAVVYTGTAAAGYRYIVNLNDPTKTASFSFTANTLTNCNYADLSVVRVVQAVT